MTTSSDPSGDDKEQELFDLMMADARDGDVEAVGKILQQCRDYLLLIANQDLDSNLQRKIGASDLVQESMMTAQAQFNQFHGSTKEHLLGWLRGILINDVRHWRRHYTGTKKRGLNREKVIGDSRQFIPDAADSMFTPSTRAASDEEEALLRNAIQELPENYQRVIQLRSWEDQSFVEIGTLLECTPDAARKLWSRAIIRLQNVLSDSWPELTPDETNPNGE